MTATIKSSCTSATITPSVAEVLITYQIPNPSFSTTLSPFTIANAVTGIDCYNYYIWDYSSDIAAAGVSGWVRFTSLTSLILNVGPKSNGYIGT